MGKQQRPSRLLRYRRLLLTTTMKSHVSLLSLLPLATLAFPTGDQVVFKNGASQIQEQWSAFGHSAMDFLDETKRAILTGKKNMEKWYHDGSEYIKQNDLLCMLFLPALCTRSSISGHTDRRTRVAPLVRGASAQSHRARDLRRQCEAVLGLSGHFHRQAFVLLVRFS